MGEQGHQRRKLSWHTRVSQETSFGLTPRWSQSSILYHSLCRDCTQLRTDHQDTFESAIQKRFGRTACFCKSHKRFRKDGSQRSITQHS